MDDDGEVSGVILALLLVIQFIRADGSVAFVTVTYDVEHCEAKAVEANGARHMEFVQVARCLEVEPGPEELFKVKGRA